MQLNGHFEGDATGEGEAEFLKAIDQLLSYSAWRDTKIALVIFSRNRDFTAVLRSIAKAVEKHPNYVRHIRDRTETSVQYEFRHRDDLERLLKLTVSAFNIPIK